MSNKKAIGYRLPATGAIATAILAFASVGSAAELVDPTRPPVVARKVAPNAPAQEGTPRVTAIIQTGDRRVAVFYGQVVKAGDRVGDMYIESVTADGVRYRRSGRVEFARLPPQAATVRRNIDSEETEP